MTSASVIFFKQYEMVLCHSHQFCIQHQAADFSGKALINPVWDQSVSMEHLADLLSGANVDKTRAKGTLNISLLFIRKTNKTPVKC